MARASVSAMARHGNGHQRRVAMATCQSVSLRRQLQEGASERDGSANLLVTPAVSWNLRPLVPASSRESVASGQVSGPRGGDAPRAPRRTVP